MAAIPSEATQADDEAATPADEAAAVPYRSAAAPAPAAAADFPPPVDFKEFAREKAARQAKVRRMRGEESSLPAAIGRIAAPHGFAFFAPSSPATVHQLSCTSIGPPFLSGALPFVVFPPPFTVVSPSFQMLDGSQAKQVRTARLEAHRLKKEREAVEVRHRLCLVFPQPSRL